MVFLTCRSYIKHMKQNRLVLVCGLSALLAGTQIGTAISADNPYVDTITNRNLFGLKAPPDPASLVPQVAPPPLPEVKLAGITTLMGTTRAILRVMRPARPPEPAKEVSLFLTPGGSEENIKVIDIDVAHGLVQISNSGTTQTLDIKKDAPKGAAAPPAPAPGMPVPGMRPGGINPIPPPTAPPVTSRPMRTGQDGVVGGGPGQMGTAAADTPPPIPSNEEQTWTMALARERDLARVAAGQMKADDIPPYPPNEVTDAADEEALKNNNNGGPTPGKF